ncbi:Protein translocase subunit SecA [Bienertia sinuspersici]
MVRCNSDPCSSSSSSNKEEEEEALGSQEYYYSSKMSSSTLFRTPSLPPCWGRDTKYRAEEEEEEEEEEDEARMGDLIRQAMPLPRPINKNLSMPKRGWIERLLFRHEKGPIAEVSKLSRRASIDTSMLPPKCYASKGTKHSTSNSKNRPHRKMDSPTSNNQSKLDTKLEKFDKSKSEKSLSDLEVEELQGFKDLGFSFDNQELSPSVTQILPALQRRASLDSNNNNNVDNNNNIGKVRRPYLSESWQKSSYYHYSPPPVPKWSDPKESSSSDDMKAQIKFWARAVASNVRQEC